MDKMEDYKQKYEQALGRAKALYAKGAPDSLHLEEMFPELKESEDEKIRKELIRAFTVTADKRDYEIYGNGITYKQVLAWLEKQGEQKPADTVEPKFKIGDWIVSNRTNKTYKIDSIDTKDANYIIYSCVPSVYTNEDSPCFSESMIHLWTIQDAKDGDVFVAKIDKEPNDFIYILSKYDKDGFWSHCYLDAYINKFHKGIYHNNHNVGVPATKEQRDLLFSKMKESGYEWDAEKKELKKIEQKPAWSDENSCYYDDICEILINLINSPKSKVNKDVVQKDLDWLMSIEKSQLKSFWSEEDEKNSLEIKCLIGNYRAGDTEYRLDSWIDSLKERVQPKVKWSEEDKRMINNIIKNLDEGEWLDIYQVDWLKSLKERVQSQSN